MRRHRYSQRGGGGKGSLLLVGILILAVAAGYAGTKYFIAPYILEGKLWVPQQSEQGGSPSQNGDGNEMPGVVSGEQDIKDAKDIPATGAAVNVTGTAAGVQTPQATSGAAGTVGVKSDGSNTTQQIGGAAQIGQNQQTGGAAQTGQNQQTGGAVQSGQSQQANAPAQTGQNQQANVAAGKYAVQFGSFSAREAADKAVKELAAKNVTASVVQKGGAYKVIGAPFDTREQAKAEVERLKNAAEDAFVTTI